jgi:hypothetical protein
MPHMFFHFRVKCCVELRGGGGGGLVKAKHGPCAILTCAFMKEHGCCPYLDFR